ncbi:hypothetical protein P7K49_022667 [Saguinus oedipus]|uniref:Uncharacterized protein n=1 Tax=Saguinus oedipus TaxID=9490 RepID=A0ABQ9UJI0_SAGOE|nr:hypothetical protein P7K49_022667 [Saguinus oedipus]
MRRSGQGYKVPLRDPSQRTGAQPPREPTSGKASAPHAVGQTERLVGEEWRARLSVGRGCAWTARSTASQPALSSQTYEHNEWILRLAGKLLAGDTEALSLLAHSPFEGRPPPR